MLRLEIATAQASYVFTESDVVTIGRREGSSVLLSDPMVSRAHAVARVVDGNWVLEDLSTGRTFLDGQAVSRLHLGAFQRVHLATPGGPWVEICVVAAARPAAPVGLGPAGSGRVPGPMASLSPLVGNRPTGNTLFAGAGASNLKKALAILFPWRAWIESSGWHAGYRAIFLFYALLPVIFVTMFWNTTNVQTLGWVYAIYTAPLWIVVFWHLIKPEDAPRTLVVYGAVVSVIVLIFMAGPLQWWYGAVPSLTTHAGDWFISFIGPGLAEEATKDGAVLLTILGLGFFLSRTLAVRSCMFLGTIAGLAFGAREAALYQQNDENLFGIAPGTHFIVEYVLLFSMRIFTDGLQHAEWAGIACFFIGLGMKYRKHRIPLFLFGYLFGALIHATNDWSASGPRTLWIVVQIVSAVLFLGYTLFAPMIESQVSESSVFRGDSVMVQQIQADQWGRPIPPGQPQGGPRQPYPPSPYPQYPYAQHPYAQHPYAQYPYPPGAGPPPPPSGYPPRSAGHAPAQSGPPPYRPPRPSPWPAGQQQRAVSSYQGVPSWPPRPDEPAAPPPTSEPGPPSPSDASPS
ncbi:MAG: FHA domain-containing protein [Acidimicrobiales bacterium]